ncbi:MAG TPA: hypothetical protein VF746_14690 [Longimicrobium sp.]|jgi:hypothetical protein
MPQPPHRRWNSADLPDAPPAREIAVSGHAVALRVLVLAEPTGVPGERLVAVTLGGRMIARAPLPEAMIGPLAAILAEPVHLLLAMRPAPLGVESTLHVVVETRRAARALGLPPAACWSSPPFAAIPVGDFVRADDERRHPHDLRAEAADQLRFILTTGPETVGERALRRARPR